MLNDCVLQMRTVMNAILKCILDLDSYAVENAIDPIVKSLEKVKTIQTSKAATFFKGLSALNRAQILIKRLEYSTFKNWTG